MQHPIPCTGRHAFSLTHAMLVVALMAVATPLARLGSRLDDIVTGSSRADTRLPTRPLLARSMQAATDLGRANGDRLTAKERRDAILEEMTAATTATDAQRLVDAYNRQNSRVQRERNQAIEGSAASRSWGVDHATDQLASELRRLRLAESTAHLANDQDEAIRQLRDASRGDVVVLSPEAQAQATPQLQDSLEDANDRGVHWIARSKVPGSVLMEGFGKPLDPQVIHQTGAVDTGFGQTVRWGEPQQLYDGVVYKKGVYEQGNGETSIVHLVYAEIGRDDISLVTTQEKDSQQRTSDWARAHDLEFAINGTFFYGAQTFGDWMSNKKRWGNQITSEEWAYQRAGTLAFGDSYSSFTHSEFVKKNRKNLENEGFSVSGGYGPQHQEASTSQGADLVPAGITEIINGFPELVIEGKVNHCPGGPQKCHPDRGDAQQRHPRTAVGISADGRHAVFVVVDGRGQNGSVGVRGDELAALVGTTGAWQAINVDGGGSSTMWTTSAKDPTGKVRNSPSDDSERVVANHIGLDIGR